ncbi:energy transducer TonB [Sphingobium sufflavum]|uniref:energy transducer TonB n=1 Tax=Sphingobium sufflavum TaxID=1129547 RepID=UPI001F286FEE|nr:energy transducer TonB [Sphingobium sufflavum]MCE7796047.1 energy transducer TonB [Sphingobium sufflavum]
MSIPGLIGVLVAASGTATPGHPVGSPADWVSTSDYPASALAAHEEGTTAFRVGFDVDGAVTTCEVTQGSGSAALDEATCRLVTARARFAPGRDAKGKPQAGTYASRVRWVIPVGVQPLPTHKKVNAIRIDIGADGKIERCQPMTDGNTAELKGCQQQQVGAFRGAYSIHEKPAPYTVILTQTVEMIPR